MNVLALSEAFPGLAPDKANGRNSQQLTQTEAAQAAQPAKAQPAKAQTLWDQSHHLSKSSLRIRASHQPGSIGCALLFGEIDEPPSPSAESNSNKPLVDP